MVSWATVVVACSIISMIYFLVRGIQAAMSGKEPPDVPEGDYEIKTLGKVGRSGFLTIMRPRHDKDS